VTEQFDVSVVISTYNRCDLLPKAIESVLAQDAGDVCYELIIVDNNSTDHTRQVVESLIARGLENLHYVFEGRQGLSYGRNAGIAKARAPIIAFTDDDVRAAPNWLTSIKRAFDTHPDADFLGGRVLPRWEVEPPPWLTREIWAGPLALVDAGDELFYSDSQCLFFFPGANFSFRRRLFDRVGLFDPNYQRVKGWVSSVEDSEFILRSVQAGSKGMYVPGVVVEADVQVERMTKDYFRKWYSSRGRYRAMLRLHEIIGSEGQLQEEPASVLKLFGTPAHLYRDSLSSLGSYLAARVLRDEKRSLRTECELRQSLNYISQRYNETVAQHKRSRLSEITSFAVALMKKKMLRGNA
jgi:glycosyltransferase involved in cell wall biosynthesis